MTTFDDLSEHPHFAFVASESYVSNSERDWLRFVARVEKIVGHDLDGNQDSDGYSLDLAHACWQAGDTAAQYAAEVMLSTAAIAHANTSKSEAA